MILPEKLGFRKKYNISAEEKQDEKGAPAYFLPRAA
jgi:hypothetical protein